MPSTEVRREDNGSRREPRASSESEGKKGKELTGLEGEGKLEVCLAEGEWEESKVTVGEEYKDEEGVVWFSSVVKAYEEKKKEERHKAFGKVRFQGLVREFPNLKVGGLLPNPPDPRERPQRITVREWDVIVAPRETELLRAKDNILTSIPEGQDERGWIHHQCCGTICAVRSLPNPQLAPKEPYGRPHP